jgi:hypothetical protein
VATPEPFALSLALTTGVTGEVYHPFEPFGTDGLSEIVVVGAVLSTLMSRT